MSAVRAVAAEELVDPDPSFRIEKVQDHQVLRGALGSLGCFDMSEHCRSTCCSLPEPSPIPVTRRHLTAASTPSTQPVLRQVHSLCPCCLTGLVLLWHPRWLAMLLGNGQHRCTPIQRLEHGQATPDRWPFHRRPDWSSCPMPQVSFGTILTPVGLGMLVYGFGGFFQLLPGGDVSSLLLIYGFVISLLGFALSYAQLKPVPCKTTAEAFALRESQCTDIQKQARVGPGKHHSRF